MANNRTEICNLALSWLGAERITSFEHDDSLQANLCRANYDLSRLAVLEEREWTFAVRRAELHPLAETPSFGFNYTFQLTNTMLRLIGVYDPQHAQQTQAPTIKHVVEARRILADLPLIHIKYISDEVGTVLFSGLFVQALAAHVAASICVALTENSTLQRQMFELYEDKLYRAAASDGLQGSREMLKTSKLENARRMYVGID